ncbi:MAG: hypothetical protein AAGI11_20185 [Pseudomonadota bacterium]
MYNSSALSRFLLRNFSNPLIQWPIKAYIRARREPEFTDRPFGIIGCDHITIQAADIPSGTRAYQRLGFIVDAPLEDSLPLPPSMDFSTAPFTNTLIRFPQPAGDINYVELMAVQHRADLPVEMAYLGEAEGPKSMVMRLTDEKLFAEEMNRKGLPCHAPFSEQGRNMFRPDVQAKMGELAGFMESFMRVMLSPVVPKLGATPLMYNGYCILMPLSAYKRMKFAASISHPNSAQRFSAMLATSDNAEHDANAMAAAWGSDAPTRAGDCFSVSAGPGCTLELYDASRIDSTFPGIESGELSAGTRYLGYRIEVKSLDTLRGVLSEQGVAYLDMKDRVLTQPADGCGAMVEFVAV